MKLSILLAFLVLSSCNSPRDNMVSEEELQNRKEQSLKDKQAGQGADSADSALVLKFVKVKITAEPVWTDGPYTEPVDSTLRVTLKDEEGELVSLDLDQYELGFNAFMPSMGHYLDDPGYFIEVSHGVYDNPAIKFNMANDWRIDLMIFDSEYEIVDLVQWLEVL